MFCVFRVAATYKPKARSMQPHDDPIDRTPDARVPIYDKEKHSPVKTSVSENILRFWLAYFAVFLRA